MNTAVSPCSSPLETSLAARSKKKGRCIRRLDPILLAAFFSAFRIWLLRFFFSLSIVVSPCLALGDSICPSKKSLLNFFSLGDAHIPAR